MRVQSPDQEDPLEEDMASHSSVLAWRIPWTQEPGGLQSAVSQKLDMIEQMNTRGTHTHGYGTYR